MTVINVMTIDQSLLNGVAMAFDATEHTIPNGSILKLPKNPLFEAWDFVDDDPYFGDDFKPNDEDGNANPNNDKTKDTSGQTVNGVRYHIDYKIIVEDSDGNQYDIFVVEEDFRTSGMEAGGDGDAFNDQQWFTFDKSNPPPLDEDLTIISSVVQGANLAYDSFIPCFAAGTVIQTPDGERLVEDLVAGDLVDCGDNGECRIRWAGLKKLSRRDLRQQPELRPILIKRHALGKNMPSRDLRVSPQHRILVDSWQIDVMFGEQETLVAAKHLVNGTTIVRDNKARFVTYHHLLFDAHQIVRSNNLQTESFYPGKQALRALDIPARKEIFSLFPELDVDEVADLEFARPILNGIEAKTLSL